LRRSSADRPSRSNFFATAYITANALTAIQIPFLRERVGPKQANSLKHHKPLKNRSTLAFARFANLFNRKIYATLAQEKSKTSALGATH
jgi:hypothetical protein